MERPPARPEGALIRLARQAAGLSIPDAVRLSGVSKARWSTVESGWESRNKVIRPVKAKPDTLARMARAVGISPERLEFEGERADAAVILREILRLQAQPPAPERPAPEPVPADGPADDAARVFPDDPAAQSYLRRGMRLGDLGELADWLDYQRERAARGFPKDRPDGATG